MKISFISIVLIALILSSCQSMNTKKYSMNEISSAKYSGYVSVKDKKRGKSYLVNFKSKLFKYDLFRLDVTAPFLGHLASVSIVKDKIQYVVPSEKKYYSGAVNSVHLKEILPFELDSHIFFNIFWGTEIKQAGWKCSLSEIQLPIKCIMLSEKTIIVWERKDGIPSKVTITHPLANVQFLINKFKANYQPVSTSEYVISNPRYK